MQTVVVTGSTRGIGLGIAKELLRRGCQVVINGRSPEAVQRQVAALQREIQSAKVTGLAGDVSIYQDVQALWEHATKAYGRVDIWINNAGVMNAHQHIEDLDAKDIAQVVAINLIGSLYGCQVAIRGMRAQGGGHVYNFEGFGSNGRQFHPYMGAYGCTKSAIRYLTEALRRETKGSGVRVGAISPGIVVTDLLSEPYRNKPAEWAKAKKIFNILGDHVETVTPFIAEELLKGRASGQTISWLTTGKVLGRFISALFRRRDLFAGATPLAN